MSRWLTLLASVLITYPLFSLSAESFVSKEMLEHLKSQYSEEAFNRGKALNRLLSELKSSDIQTQLKEVNRFFNQFRYTADIVQWGQKDYWATPQEFLGTQKGDCEDFVVSKYFALRKLGVSDERLYLTYVKALKQGVAHMVLSYFETPSSTPLILDNYNPMILKANKRQDLLPIYSFNANSLFLSNASAGLGKSLPTDKIKNSKWQKLLSDLKKENK